MSASRKRIVLWVLQVVCAAVLIPFGYLKLSGSDVDVRLFTELGMEPQGRIIIGLIEMTAGLFLATNRLAAAGAFLTVGVMLGAIIAHSSVLGFDVDGDGGKHVLFLVLVFTLSLIVTIARRRELPLFGSSLD